jgi:hypothetical protein
LREKPLFAAQHLFSEKSEFALRALFFHFFSSLLEIEAATSEKNLSEEKKSCYNYLQSLLAHDSFRPLKTETTMLGVVALRCWPTGLPDYSAFSNI